MNKRLYDLLKSQGRTQIWLANKLGMGASSLSLKLSDQRRLTLKEAKEMARILEVSLDYLVGTSNDPSPSKGEVRFHAIWVDGQNPQKRLLLVNEVVGGSTVVFDVNRHVWESPEEEAKADATAKELWEKLTEEGVTQPGGGIK